MINALPLHFSLNHNNIFNRFRLSISPFSNLLQPHINRTAVSLQKTFCIKLPFSHNGELKKKSGFNGHVVGIVSIEMRLPRIS